MGNARSKLVRLGTSALLWAFVSALTISRDYPSLLQIRDHPADDSGDAGSAPKNYTVCNYNAQYDSLFELNTSIAKSAEAGNAGPNAGAIGQLTGGGTMRSDCIVVYGLQALITMMDTAYENYTSMIKDGYDKEFDYYVKYVEKTVPEVIDGSLMFDKSKATDSMAMAPVGSGMKYFECKIENSDHTFPCADMEKHDLDMINKVTKMTLKDDMEDDYNAALVKAGITPDWVHFSDHTIVKDQMVLGRLPFTRSCQYKFSGYPVAKENMDIPNPKDIVTKGLPNIPHLLLDMRATYLDIILGQFFGGPTTAAVEAYSPPVFLLKQAVHNMAQAKELGEKEEKEEEEQRRNFIIMIVSVVLMFVPFVGQEVAVAAGMASLARAILIAGEVGNGALGLYDSVKNPDSAIINVLGMLVGFGNIAKVSRDGLGLAKVAKVSRTLNFKGFGQVVKNDHDGLLTVLSHACKAK